MPSMRKGYKGLKMGIGNSIYIKAVDMIHLYLMTGCVVNNAHVAEPQPQLLTVSNKRWGRGLGTRLYKQ